MPSRRLVLGASKQVGESLVIGLRDRRHGESGAKGECGDPDSRVQRNLSHAGSGIN